MPSSNQLVKDLLGVTKGLLKDLGHFNNPDAYKNQSYTDLRHRCHSNGTLFEDPEFPANMSSLFFTNRDVAVPQSAIEWKRPTQLCAHPKLYTKGYGIGPNTAMQGQLGNCWFVAACSVLSQFPNLRRVVIPEGEVQDFGAGKYAGIFHFRFYRFGNWIDVVIDDRLPTRNGKLLFVRSIHEDEFWSALVEKAYAKLAGCYEALDGGNLTDALVDFTGGVAETVDLEGSKYLADVEARDALFKQLQKEIIWDSLMCAAITVRSRDEMEAQLTCGLVKGHAYGITGVQEIAEGEQPNLFATFFQSRTRIQLIRLRNPWGRTEWNGPFADNAKEWSKISQAERHRLGLTFAEDGEFWMPFEDFIRYFSMMSICHIMYGSLIGSIIARGAPNWSESIFHSRWTRPDRAGGCINNRNTFLKNPQFRFDVANKEEVMISLEQRDVRSNQNMHQTRPEYLPIGFQLLKVEENRKTRVRSIREPVDASTYINSRMVIMSKVLKPGRYVIIPSTFSANQEGEFLLRIYTDEFANNAKELSDDLPSTTKSLLGGLIKLGTGDNTYVDVAYLTIKSASGLSAGSSAQPDNSGAVDYYCKLHCEQKEVRIPLSRASASHGNPEWNSSVIFYRKHPEKPINIEIWVAGRFSDQAIAVCQVTAPKAEASRVFIKQEPLRPFHSHSGGANSGATAGILSLEIASYDDITNV